ncbi:DOMON-like domain-containing protein [Novosphingobium bradum]|uniref:DOMON-like domain-containing protein n=1 Tax=Novosphingobium bradum TaxID=1737444 RepID=A0ABV7IP48_9SPHN
METLSLSPHADHAPDRVSAVSASVIGLDRNWLRVRWRVADSAGVVVPPFAGKARADGLWQRTCFELFLRSPGSAAYVELNLSPSEEWAAYDFSGYRAGMAERAMPHSPDGTIRRGGNVLIFDASVPMAGLPPLPWDVGISAVIEEQGGTRSLWALRYGPGQADFHAPACFAARLAAPDGS